MARSSAPVLSNRALNRAVLARQMLLERQAVGVQEVLRLLVGLQGQNHNAPYFGLWSRIEGFSIGDLETLLKERKAVRGTLMRGTLHVAMAEDYLAIRPLLGPTLERIFNANHRKRLPGADIEAIRQLGRDLLDKEALSAGALGKKLAESMPGHNPTEMGMVTRILDDLVHVPPAGLWGATKAPTLRTARSWLEKEPGEGMALTELVRRYLAAFGPASKADFTAWSGLAGAEAFEAMRDELVVFAGEDGRELFDLPEAPRPDADMPAPARLLADYDNILIGYADRARMADPKYLTHLMTINGIFNPTFTVDGFVHGLWKLTSGDSSKVTLRWFMPLKKKDEAALTREAKSLLDTFAGGKGEVIFQAFE
jgi:hypothetical protein